MLNKIAFFGTPLPAVEILEWLKRANLLPTLVVTNPDKPQGRNLILTPSPVKVWADKENILALQPEKIDAEFIVELRKQEWDLFVVVAYGKILPQSLIEIPKKGCINVHYSFLPKYRGASPIESQILADDKNPGVSILLIDEKMDHGNILGEAPVPIENWPPTGTMLRLASNQVAGELLTNIIPKWLAGEIEPKEQDHDKATYTKKFEKSDGELDLTLDPYQNFLKIQAFEERPGTYFFSEKSGKKTRVIIKKATFANNKLEILRVIPEGKKEIDYSTFLAQT